VHAAVSQCLAAIAAALQQLSQHSTHLQKQNSAGSRWVLFTGQSLSAKCVLACTHMHCLEAGLKLPASASVTCQESLVPQCAYKIVVMHTQACTA
jgi:hypothetical protein